VRPDSNDRFGIGKSLESRKVKHSSTNRCHSEGPRPRNKVISQNSNLLRIHETVQ